MSPTPRRGRRRIPYWVSFAVLTLLLGGGTAAFVLGVLPRRFVLQTGLKESGVGFPSRTPEFGPERRAPLVRPAPPRPAPETPPPGPAEAFWARVMPLLRADRWAEALPVFRDYLADHPDDPGALREYAITLRKAGRDARAETALRRLVKLTGSFEDRRALARVLRDEGRTDRAVALYRKLAAERPGDASLRLEMARALLWAGRPEKAGEALALLPDSVLEGAAARGLADTVRARLAAPAETAAAVAEAPKPPPGLLERARAAAAHDSLRLASSLYARAARAHPDSAAAWLEWADLLELRLQDYGGAASALARGLELSGKDGAQRVRLARLEAWSGHEGRAREILEGLVAREPDRADAWAWLGDLRRFAGDRPGAASAYRRALALEPGQERATSGLAALDARNEEILAAREPRGSGPDGSLFLDSDRFRQVDASLFGRARSGSLVVDGRAGWRLLHGRTLGSTPAERTLQGGFADAEAARWWRQATVRTSLSLGAERLEGGDVRPHWGAGLRLPEAGGFALAADYEHAPAYPLTRTLESVLEPVTADHLSLSAFRSLGSSWSVRTAADLAFLSAAPADNVRVAGSLALRRRLAAWLTGGYVTRWVGFDDPAPAAGAATNRRLYWDPRSFWSHQLLVEAATPAGGDGWGAHLGLRGGFALVDERGVASTTVPQLEVDGGLDRSAPWGSLSAGLFYGRAREGGYESFGAQLGVRVKLP